MPQDNYNTETKLLTEADVETEVDLIMDFASELGGQLIIRGGELWRTEELLHEIFGIYNLKDASVMILSNMLIISARREGKKTITRQKNIGEMAVNLEILTNLKKLVQRLHKEQIPPENLMQLLQETLEVPLYSFPAVLLGVTCALLSLVYLFNGGIKDAAVVVVCNIGIQVMNRLLGQVHGTNKMALNASATFFGGCVALAAYQIGFITDPYLVMIVVAFALLPGLQLVNAARELLYGRAMSGSLFLLQVFLETLSIVAGFAFAIFLMGGA